MTKKEILAVTNSLHLLYVEDDALLRESSKELFSNFFETIDVAQDGAQALEMYENNSYDLIITDIFMPKMDGIELIRRIREQNLKLPIIVFSALSDATSMTSCISLNVDAYLLKPLILANFIEALERVALKITHLNQRVEDPVLIINNIQETFMIDELTGLKSHNALLESIENLQAREIPVLILVNIDEFHIYNEIYGLQTGDTILKKFAKLLEQFEMEGKYSLYRMSGDEFVFFEVVDSIDPDSYIHDIEELIAYIETNPIILPTLKEPINLTVTVGVAFDKENSYGKADMALQEARRRGRQYLGYNIEADKRAELQTNLYWKEEINKALEEGRVHTYYQAIVDKDKNTIKYEALVRIRQIQADGSEKIVAPYQFLDFSKVSRQYIGLTNVVIQESFDTMIEKNAHVSINLTFHDIANKEISKLLRESIQKHHLESKTNFDISSQIIFELLAHTGHKDYDTFVKFVDDFKALGVLITIDNFGLGFSDMSKIAAISPHYVKIDSSLIKNIDTDKHARALVSAIVKFTKELGIKTIAEHVESEAIFAMAKELEIDEFQGYYFGEPLAAVPSKDLDDA